MGNWATIYTLDSAEPRLSDDDERHAKFRAVAKYHLPIAWLALYSSDDLRMVEVDTETHLEDPFLIASTASAMSRLRAREQTLLEKFPNFVDAKAWLDDFIDALTSDGQPYVHLETADLGSMSMDSEAWAAELQSMLSALDGDSAQKRSAWARLFGRKNSQGWARYFHFFPLPSESSRITGAAYLVGDGY